MTKSYLATMCFLIFHQIDAAYWREWDMFFLPGGIQGYLLFNIAIIPVLILGYKNVVESSKLAVRYAYFCSGLGVTTFVVHAIFLVLGYDQFKLPLSLVIIAFCLLSSIWQIKQTISHQQAI